MNNEANFTGFYLKLISVFKGVSSQKRPSFFLVTLQLIRGRGK